MKRKIYYYDTDCGGVVYHANYLHFYEEARTELLETCGLSAKQLLDDGYQMVLSHQEIYYKYPAFYQDVLDVRARVVELSPVRMVHEYQIFNQNGRLINEGFTTVVCVNKQGSPAPWPEYVKQKVVVEPKMVKERK